MPKILHDAIQIFQTVAMVLFVIFFAICMIGIAVDYLKVKFCRKRS